MALAIDGSISFSAFGTSVAVTLSTAQPNDIICLTIAGAITSPLTVSDSTGLTWTRRSVTTVGANRLEFWYAKAASPLTSCVITTTYATNQAPRLVAWGVSGANFANPFDPNASLPSVVSTASTVTTQSAVMSTDNATCMLIGVARFFSGWGAGLTRPSGWTMLINVGTAQDTAYRIVTAAEVSASKAWSWSNPSGNILLLDAIAAAPNIGDIAATTNRAGMAASGAESIPGALAITTRRAIMAASGVVSGDDGPFAVDAYDVLPQVHQFSPVVQAAFPATAKPPIINAEPYKIG